MREPKGCSPSVLLVVGELRNFFDARVWPCSLAVAVAPVADRLSALGYGAVDMKLGVYGVVQPTGAGDAALFDIHAEVVELFLAARNFLQSLIVPSRHEERRQHLSDSERG